MKKDLKQFILCMALGMITCLLTACGGDAPIEEPEKPEKPEVEQPTDKPSDDPQDTPEYNDNG